MDKRSKIVLGVFCLVILGIIITEIVRPRPINWRPSYTNADKIPYGCYVLYNELSELFNTADIETVYDNTYDALSKTDSIQKSGFIFINNFIYFDEQETYKLLDYVHQGNTVFIASADFGGILSDTLNINVLSSYNLQEEEAELNFTNNKFKNQKYTYSRGMLYARFYSIDTLNSKVLGHIKYTERNVLENLPDVYIDAPNFIQTQFGKGTFLLNTTPQAYTNYYVLGDNQEYVANTFSYFEEDTIYWDNYKKSGRVVVTSPLRFVLTQNSLKWAYYLTMGSLILFVLFRAKRQQRIIPVIKPLENSSVEFARTVGALYYQNKDYTDLIHKKITYFLAYLRNRYHLELANISDRTVQTLAAKSGKGKEETKKLLELIVSLKNKKAHTEQDSILLNKTITDFKK
ncbi:DUF4350 domain-containing protein [Flagellimonas meridianipacifica]|uniref:Uncharacterized protein DUF4350 n=1 Tax=Flagellimonas meridianipacifica TaxID=1080225 RepID=A0A2T0MDC3_9FLAO|nr:DUF4350 domain-containing protein [Allomuricauda pacifica]PRX55492.1 uncharacterized protein DUF4350 [Allomuricauda pacifica]